MHIRELTIARFHDALRAGQTTCHAVTAAYLRRISAYDPVLKALICVNKNALDAARQKDVETAAILARNDRKLPPLHGVPLILKDTYGTKDMPTTAGCRALSSLQTKDDAFVVRKLRVAGAIILAKANLHELSMQGITVSSLGGQTRNPYDLSRTPGGSSGGTAAALAANLGLGGCGGDTMNSLRSPASACAIVGFRPTAGQVSRSGTVPVAHTQDAVGPMARTVQDVRVLFEVMRGEDPADPITLSAERDAAAATTTTPRRRYRIGVLDTYFGQESGSDKAEISTVNKTVLHALDKGRQHGLVELVHVSLPADCDVASLLASTDVQSYEFREAIDSFLQSDFIQHTPHKTLESISRHEGGYLREAMSQSFFETLLQSDTFNTSSPEYGVRLRRIAKLKESLADCFRRFGLDALAYPHQRVLVSRIGPMNNQPGRNGILAALTGRPAICIPDPDSTSDSALGVPIGLEFLGQPWKDFELLDLAERFEEVLQARKDPEEVLRSAVPATAAEAAAAAAAAAEVLA
ncbi:Amidase [Rasamsonia emersonii CBS 393.64]|uniref:Amidase n=1 Tax=Rasamsonia emersonii (strain ATCC 16479 / CBS 393.64 / IMI 116815) TaxID=1408163 RepID=A0A0F4YPM6_RASE3|nr:Amidase [Rasamsonia emersonii CBS 393.64]KKA19791.1 Amidase [Rasamsonia emersonii CBS 393.64]